MEKISIEDFFLSIPFKRKSTKMFFNNSWFYCPNYLKSIVRMSVSSEDELKKRFFSYRLLSYQVAGEDKSLFQDVIELVVLSDHGLLLSRPKRVFKSLNKHDSFVLNPADGKKYKVSPVWQAAYIEIFGIKRMKTCCAKHIEDIKEELMCHFYKNGNKRFYPQKAAIERNLSVRLIVDMLSKSGRKMMVEI